MNLGPGALSKATSLLYISIVSILLAGGVVLIEGRIGFNPADEGFLWYGAEATLAGQVPVRDFQSYFPGRYYWSSLWMHLTGPGIVSLRMSNAMFQAIGLIFGLMLASRIFSSKTCLFLFGILLTVWMFPRHKLFESSITMMAVYFAVLTIEKPNRARLFASGVFIGLAGFFGPNHALYVLLSFMLLIALIWFKTESIPMAGNLSALIAGILTGFSPILTLILFYPGLLESVIESVMSVSRNGTNIPLPVPWPWRVIPQLLTSTSLDVPQAAFQTFGSICFLAMPIFFGTTIVMTMLSGTGLWSGNSVLIASAVVGFFYQHHAFSRADMGHLAQVMPPLAIALISIPKAIGLDKIRTVRISTIFFIIAGIFSGLWAHDYYHYLKSKQAGHHFQEVKMGRDILWVISDQARLMGNMRQILEGRTENVSDAFFAPHWPGMYPALNRKSPVWEIYFFHPATEKQQRRMISDMEKSDLRVVIIGDEAVDGRDEFRFMNTHPLVWDFITRNFQEVWNAGLPPGYHLLTRKEAPRESLF